MLVYDEHSHLYAPNQPFDQVCFGWVHFRTYVIVSLVVNLVVYSEQYFDHETMIKNMYVSIFVPINHCSNRMCVGIHLPSFYHWIFFFCVFLDTHSTFLFFYCDVVCKVVTSCWYMANNIFQPNKSTTIMNDMYVYI